MLSACSRQICPVVTSLVVEDFRSRPATQHRDSPPFRVAVVIVIGSDVALVNPNLFVDAVRVDKVLIAKFQQAEL